jgi:hypothetical protein
MSALPTTYDPTGPNAFPAPKRTRGAMTVAPRTRTAYDKAQEQLQRNQALVNQSFISSRQPSLPAQLPMTPYAENNIAQRDTRQAMQRQMVENRNAAYEQSANEFMQGRLPAAGDGSFTGNQGLNPGAPAVHKLPSAPPQPAPEFNDYEYAFARQYRQLPGARNMSPAEVIRTQKPTADKIQQGMNAAYAGKPTLPEATANARRESASIMSSVRNMPNDEAGWLKGRPDLYNDAGPHVQLPVSAPAATIQPTATAQLPQTTYSNNGLQGQGTGRLPGSGMVQGADLDAMGAKYGLERGRIVINGQDFGPRTDAAYWGLIREKIGQSADAQLKTNPQYQQSEQRMADIKTARQSGVGVSAVEEKKKLAAMSPAERMEAQWDQAIQALPPEQQAVAIERRQGLQMSIKQAEERLAAAQSADEKKLAHEELALEQKRQELALKRTTIEQEGKLKTRELDLKERELATKPGEKAKPVVGENAFNGEWRNLLKEAATSSDKTEKAKAAKDLGWSPPFRFPKGSKDYWFQSPSGSFARNFYDQNRHFRDYKVENGVWVNMKTGNTLAEDKAEMEDADAPVAANTPAAPATPAAPVSIPKGNGQPLTDENTAKAILDAAGGDKNKAREIAAQNGWKL